MKIIITSVHNTPEITALIKEGIPTGTPHLPIISFKQKKIKYANKYFSILIKNLTFEQELTFIHETYGAFYSDDYTNANYLPNHFNCSWSIKLKPSMSNGLQMNNSWYSPTQRKTAEAFIQHIRPKTVVFFGASGFGKEVLALLQCNADIKTDVHIYGQYVYPFNYAFKNTDSFDDDLNYFKFKYLRLDTTIANLAPESKNHNIYLHNYNIYDALVHMLNNQIIPDYIYFKKYNGLRSEKDIINIIKKILFINPRVVINMLLYSKNRSALKDIVFKEFKIIFIPSLKQKHLLKNISPKYPANRSYIITNINLADFKNLPPLSNFSKYPNITNEINSGMHINKFRFKKMQKYDLIIENYSGINNSIKEELYYRDYKTIFFETYDRYKTDLDLLQSFIKNDYIMKIRLLNIINMGLLYFPLESSINIPECIFIHKLIKAHCTSETFIIELGCAYGMSGMIIANCMKQNNISGTFISIDPNQRSEWHGVGEYNIKHIIEDIISIKYNLIQEYSTALSKYSDVDVVFIDGAHDFINVYHDIKTADKVLNIGGIMILDDVLHEGVAEAMALFFGQNYDKYNKIFFNDKDKIIKINYAHIKGNYTNIKGNYADKFRNPRTMSAFIKLY